jgi:geranylgeranyl pyrophosphate synthase
MQWPSTFPFLRTSALRALFSNAKEKGHLRYLPFSPSNRALGAETDLLYINQLQEYVDDINQLNVESKLSRIESESNSTTEIRQQERRTSPTKNINSQKMMKLLGSRNSTITIITQRWAIRTELRNAISTRRCKSSSSLLADFVPDSVRSAVKSTLIHEATKADSSMWVNGHHQTNGASTSIDHSISDFDDDLLEWHLDERTRYWPSLPDGVLPHADPFALCKSELDSLSKSIRKDLLGTEHPVLNQAASYFFESSADGGKKVRPMMVLLLCRALSDTIAPSDGASLWSTPLVFQRPDLPQAQRRLAEISEMIHTASLFHDDVIDGSDTRRGVPAVHKAFGNKMAILAGDYLLARASISLARLRNTQVVECMSTIIEHLVRGEVMQMHGGDDDRLSYYLRKNYYKTGSLMANSCRSAALLGEYSPELVEASYRYGKHIGMAFQLVDDVLDLEGSSDFMGKPAFGDLKAGLATAPVLFALEEYGDALLPLVERKFKQEGDVEAAVEMVFRSQGITRTKELAQVHAELAMEALMGEFSPGLYRDALVHLAYTVVDRTR